MKNRVLLASLICTLSIPLAMRATTSEISELDLAASGEVAAASAASSSKPAAKQDAHVFTEAELNSTVDEKIDALTLTAAEKDALKKAKKKLVEKLKGYKVTGFAFCVDGNIALIYDNQDPKFKLTYKNADGDIKERTYQASISSWGIKGQLAAKVNFIFITDTDFYNSNKIIELGWGIDVSVLPVLRLLYDLIKWSEFKDYCGHFNAYMQRYGMIRGMQAANVMLADHPYNNRPLRDNSLLSYLLSFDFLYAPFKNVPGRMFMASYSGIGVGGGLSVVSGGTLKPVAYE